MNTKSPEELNARIAHLERSLEASRENSVGWMRQFDAVNADRKKLEAEVRRLTDEAGRKSPWPAGCHQGAEEQMATRIYGRKDRFGDGEGMTAEAARACARRELEMAAHGIEEKSMAKYWQDKYEELKRLKALEDKVAADQVASLQKKLEDARVEINQMRCERIGNPVRCEEETRWALHCSEKTNAELRGKIEAVEQINKQLMSENADIKRRYEGAVNEGLCLKAWKESMNQVMNRLDLQGIGRELGVPLGEDIALKALPAIRDLKAQLEGARARASQEAEDSTVYIDGTKHFSESPHFRRMITAIGAEILEINRGNGWDVTQPSDWPITADTKDGVACLGKIGTNLALIHSEVSEALEAIRHGDRQNFEEELADVLIRVLDTSHGLGIDLGPVICAKLKKNRGRGHKHGGKAI